MGEEQLIAEENPAEAIIAVGHWEHQQEDTTDHQGEKNQLEEVRKGGPVSEIDAVSLSIQ